MISRFIVGTVLAVLALGAGKQRVVIVAGSGLGEAAQYGVAQLESALAKKQVGVSVRQRGQGRVTVRIAPEDGAEGFVVRRVAGGGGSTLEITGGDDRGLMYGLLDVAERVGWSGNGADPFSEVREVNEKPAVKLRALSIYTMNPAYFESRLYNEDYWKRYFDMLARNRFNTFVVVFGYENAGYFAPAYPYFFEVEGFPGVKVVGLTKERQAENHRALQRMMDLAHERGLNFSVALWDHVYRGGVQGPAELAAKPTPGLVWGIDAKNLTSYIPAAFARFLKEFPDVDIVQFRMHGESGIKPAEMRAFWESMYGVMKQAPKHVSFEFRLKEFPDDLIARAVELGLPFRLETKYWAEQMGMPFHPTHIQQSNQFDRRHGYADVLRYPKRYDIGYRLWNGGTSRVLLWGDPDYARRFAESAHLYDGAGYEVNEPLATKMLRAPEDMKPFDLLRPQYRYYDYEFERYWHFYQVFGRMGYDPTTSSEVWDHEFRSRFGDGAGPLLEQALHRASWILPRIEAYCQPLGKFPTTRGWAERQRWDDLPAYAKAEPSDTAQFESFSEAAECRVTGKCTAKTTLAETRRWFEKTADDVLRLVGEAESRAGSERSKEFVSTTTDLRMLAELARYHAERIPAGLSYALFQRTHDVDMLDDAIADEARAMGAWQDLVRAAGDVYTDNLVFGLANADLTGHWRDELPKLAAGIAALEKDREAFRLEARRLVTEQRLGRRYVSTISVPNGAYELKVGIDPSQTGYGPMFIEANGTDYTDVFSVPPGKSAEKSLETTVSDGTLNIVLGAEASGVWHADRVSVSRVDPVIAHVPVRRVRPGESVEMRAGIGGVAPIRVARVMYGGQALGFKSVDLREEGGGRYKATLPADALANGTRYWIEAVDEQGRRGVYPEGGAAEAIRVIESNDEQPPTIHHDRIAHARADQPMSIKATVSDPSGVAWVRVRYRGVNQHQDYAIAEMLPTGEKDEYRAVIPAGRIDPKWDFMYYIEAMDAVGNSTIYPDMDRETPYVVVSLDRGANVTQHSDLLLGRRHSAR